MNPVMYIFLNRELRMSTGKSAAQAAHAAVEAYKLSDPELIVAWYVGGHYTKLVMAAEDTIQMNNIGNYIMDRGFHVAWIVDEGRTEVRPHSLTALGVEIVDKDDRHTAATFEGFKVFREIPPPIKPWWSGKFVVGR
jgi:PTH2 family peptidyl-tRNA hydrolase